MKILRIDHIAVAVPELDPAVELFAGILGLLPGPREYVPTQLTDTAFLLTAAEAEACVELIAPRPREENVGLEKFLSRLSERPGDRRGGLHHIAFAVEDLAAALDELAERGVPLIDRAPRPGARGHQVAFLHPRALGGVLVELVAVAGH
jgi:methylmalonyl-CoA/ethylmalonyl-CoA epimerase